MDQAAAWKNDLKAYIDANGKKRGSPMHDPQILEMYYSSSQIEARQHPNLAQARCFLNSLYRYRDEKDGRIFFHPCMDYAYPDRVRWRTPGLLNMQLSNHIDNGSIERWITGSSRKLYNKIFSGNWQDFDAFDAEFRVSPEIIESPNASTFFRSFQGQCGLDELLYFICIYVYLLFLRSFYFFFIFFFVFVFVSSNFYFFLPFVIVLPRPPLRVSFSNCIE